MSGQKTHREVRTPQISARYLADYMAASETAKRTIVRASKYRAIARIIQHNDAKLAIAKFFREGKGPEWLLGEAVRIRNKLHDDDFEQDVADHNAEYIERFVTVFPSLKMPDVEILAAGPTPPLKFHDVKVTVDMPLRLRRLTKTNKIRVGAITFRYAKGKALSHEVAEWQSSFTHGYVASSKINEQAEVECSMCLTLDAHSAELHPAPTRAVSNFKHMVSACATIAERWPNIQPPPGAVL